MRDDAYSRHVRSARSLHDDWRVYKLEVVEGKERRVRLTGAIARPATEHDGGKLGEPVWFKPMIGRTEMVVPMAVYRGLASEERASR